MDSYIYIVIGAPQIFMLLVSQQQQQQQHNHWYYFISMSLSISIASGALMLLNIHVAHLSVRTCELRQNGQLDPDAVSGGEWGRA